MTGRLRGGLPFTLRLEPRLETSRWLSPALTAGALVVALVISGLILAIVGADPIRVYVHIVGSSLGSIGAISDTLVKSTPLILTGLACALAFRMRLWNIGAEGQLLLGAWAASAVVLAPLLPAGTPGFVVLPVMLVAGLPRRGRVGPDPGHPQGALRGQRDHRHPDAQQHRPRLDPVLGVRAVDRGRLPADGAVPRRGLAPPPRRPRRRVSRRSAA